MGFECYHPAINLIYFVAVITATFLFRQPVFLGISYCCAFAYSIKRNGWRSLVFNLALLPLLAVFTFYYSSYNHFGITILGQNFIGNNMTLESIVFGATLGLQAAAFIMWMSCVHSVFTADKVVYLFGRVSPKLSLYLAIVLRMVPRLKTQARKISVARKAIGRGSNQGNFFCRMKNGLAICSMVVTWLLESFSTIAESMRCRGYSLKGRTAFSIYRFDNRDRSFVVALFACVTLLLMGFLLHQTSITFDPRIMMSPITGLSFLFYAGQLCLCLLPMSLEIIGEQIFRHERVSV